MAAERADRSWLWSVRELRLASFPPHRLASTLLVQGKLAILQIKPEPAYEATERLHLSSPGHRKKVQLRRPAASVRSWARR